MVLKIDGRTGKTVNGMAHTCAHTCAHACKLRCRFALPALCAALAHVHARIGVTCLVEYVMVITAAAAVAGGGVCVCVCGGGGDALPPAHTRACMRTPIHRSEDPDQGREATACEHAPAAAQSVVKEESGRLKPKTEKKRT